MRSDVKPMFLKWRWYSCSSYFPSLKPQCTLTWDIKCRLLFWRTEFLITAPCAWALLTSALITLPLALLLQPPWPPHFSNTSTMPQDLCTGHPLLSTVSYLPGFLTSSRTRFLVTSSKGPSLTTIRSLPPNIHTQIILYPCMNIVLNPFYDNIFFTYLLSVSTCRVSL